MAKNRENGDKNRPVEVEAALNRCFETKTYQTIVSPPGSPAIHPQSGDLIMPGSFNPLHSGHMEMAAIATAKFSRVCWFELSITNADKNRLSPVEVAERLKQNFGSNGLVVSQAAAFLEKSNLFPGTIFVVGADTILRIGDLKYYASNRTSFERSIDEIKQNGCQFLVFGRKVANKFVQQQNIELAEKLMELCQFVERSEFENDLSSTQLRNSNYGLGQVDCEDR